MVQYGVPTVDQAFGVLADGTRRGILEWLARQDASITELAEAFQMTLTGMKKHVGVLEKADLVVTEKVGRVRTCRLGTSRLEAEAAWMDQYQRLWTARFEGLDLVMEELKEREKRDGNENGTPV